MPQIVLNLEDWLYERLRIEAAQKRCKDPAEYAAVIITECLDAGKERRLKQSRIEDGAGRPPPSN